MVWPCLRRYRASMGAVPIRYLLTSMLALASTPALSAGASWPDLTQAPPVPAGDGSADAALVVAVEDYVFVPDLVGAEGNGRAWVTWLRESRGVPTVKVLVDAQATREEILTAARGIAQRVGPGGRVWVVFIGHGAPSQATDDGVLVGVDAQSSAASLDARSVTRSELIAALAGAQSETVAVLDACFSGQTATGDLVPGLAPLKPISARIPGPVTILTGATGSQYAGPLSDGSRPAFSYLALGALRGWADTDGDQRVSAQEVATWTNDALFKTTLGRTQTPTIEGVDLVLSPGREPAPDLDALAPKAGRAQVAAFAEAQRLREAADAQESAALEQLRRDRGARLDGLAEARRHQASLAWFDIWPVLEGGGPEARGVARAFAEDWPTQVEVEVVDVDGRHRRTVEIPEGVRVRDWLRDNPPLGRGRRLRAATGGVAIGLGGAALVTGQILRASALSAARRGEQSMPSDQSAVLLVNGLTIGGSVMLAGGGGLTVSALSGGGVGVGATWDW